MVSKFHSETYDPKGQENKIYTIVKDMETLYSHHTVPPAVVKTNMFLKRLNFGRKESTKELKMYCVQLLLNPDLRKSWSGTNFICRI